MPPKEGLRRFDTAQEGTANLRRFNTAAEGPLVAAGAYPNPAECLLTYDTWAVVKRAVVTDSKEGTATMGGYLAPGTELKGKIDESLKCIQVSEGEHKGKFVHLQGRGARTMQLEPLAKELSVVVPTYNEVENIEPLCKRLFAALKKDVDAKILDAERCELLFMDDESVGSDKTLEIVTKLRNEGFPVRIRARRKVEGRGLSSAVLEGIRLARYWHVLVMDADLQHEPESVASVAAPVVKKVAQMSVGSRYCEGGGLGFEWSIVRRAISVGATLLSKGVANTTDPMSGFFCIRKNVVHTDAVALCNPIGFKIALEVAVKCELSPVKDVPISFQERAAGESKLSKKQMIEYVFQLIELYLFVLKRSPALLFLAFTICVICVVLPIGIYSLGM